jgi:NitT/TauT family transport system permease protein
MRSVRWLLRLGSFVVFAVGWELLAGYIDGLLFPTFTETVVALARLIATPTLWQAIWLSHQALVLGFVPALVLGVGGGLLMGRWTAADAFIDPYLTVLLVTPMSALIPVIIMAVGLDLPARALVVLLFAVVVIAVSTRAGLRTLDPGWVDMVRSFGASERDLWRTVLLPGALPAIMTGLRLGLARAFAGMVAVELLLVAIGVGRLIVNFQGAFDGAAVYATVMVLVVEAVTLLQGLKWLERRLAPWADRIAIE